MDFVIGTGAEIDQVGRVEQAEDLGVTHFGVGASAAPAGPGALRGQPVPDPPSEVQEIAANVSSTQSAM